MQQREKLTNTLLKDDKQSQRMKRKPMFDQTSTQLLNGVKLSFQRGFGFTQSQQVTTPAHSIDDNKIIYLLGKQVIQYDMLTENQKVIDSIEQQEEITAFVYFKNLMLDDNIMLAIHAMNKTYPAIVAKNYSKGMSQKYVMAHLEKEQKIVELLLINENKYIVALSQLQGTYRLSYIDVQTKQVMASESIYFKVTGMFVPEAFTKSIILYTQIQLYLIQFGTEIKPISLGFSKSLQNQQHIVQAISSCFTTSEIIVYLITTGGDLMFVNINIIMQKVQTVQRISLGQYETIDQTGAIIKRPKQPSSLCCNQYNILIGYHFVQQFSLIKICPILTAKPTPQRIPFSCPNLHKIMRMQFAHETMSICIIVQVKQNDRYDLSIKIQSDYLREKGEQQSTSLIKSSINKHSLKPGKIFPVVFNMLLHDTLVETLRSPIQSILGWMIFVKQILDIAILPTKKIMLILSKQRKMKAIKYQHLNSTSFQRMLLWQMHFNINDCPTSLDIHPLTFNVAIGFKQGLKLFTISSEGLKPTTIQFPLKNCQSVRYSKFGHKLIAGSSNQIIIINPYQNNIIQSISLSSGYNIKELQFIDRDMYVFCQYMNGASGVMNCQGGKVFQVWKKENKTICSAYDNIFDVMVVSYTENFTKFYRQRCTQEFGVLWTYPFNITRILIVNELGTIFMGTSLGKIRAYQWPFTDMMRFSKSFTQLQLHSSPITKLKIIHDYSLLISGAQDGSIFISKINAYSDGIAITDSQIMHSLKSGSKNYTNLFYLQNYMITSSGIEFGQQETIVQLQSDKADFQTEYSEVILAIEGENEERLKKQQRQKQQQFREQLQGRQVEIQQLNEKKILVRQQILQVLKQKNKAQQQLQSKKQQQMRGLYKQRDLLQQQKSQLQATFLKQTTQQQLLLNSILQKQRKQWSTKQNQLQQQIYHLQQQHHSSVISYNELLKQQNQQGIIYKNKMLQQLQTQFQQQKQTGQKLRKSFNKIKHQNAQLEEKLKTFQQMITQIQIDNVSNVQRCEDLKVHQGYLTQVLLQKDRVILQQEKHVKELLSKNINNYTHEEYLKHKQQELLEKVKFLEQQILELDEKYNNFQTDFVNVTTQSNQVKDMIQNAKGLLLQCKQKDQKVKQELYMKQYGMKLLMNDVVEAFHQSKCDKQDFLQSLELILQQQQTTSTSLTQGQRSSPTSLSPSNSQSSLLLTNFTQQTSQQKIQKRDHLIKQVVNTNKLRKIDDNIRRTIMIKLNRETVSLTCEVNQLRKEKKKLATKVKQLKQYIDEIGEGEYTGAKENGLKMLKKSKTQARLNSGLNDTFQDDIVPANISIIRSKPSKHIALATVSSRQKLLPFQLYHSNKSKHSYHSRSFVKGDLDESSTQLPSLLPSLIKNGSISEEDSALFSVGEIVRGEERQ